MCVYFFISLLIYLYFFQLLSREIRHERNVILQCIRYTVQNEFFTQRSLNKSENTTCILLQCIKYLVQQNCLSEVAQNMDDKISLDLSKVESNAVGNEAMESLTDCHVKSENHTRELQEESENQFIKEEHEENQTEVS